MRAVEGEPQEGRVVRAEETQVEGAQRRSLGLVGLLVLAGLVRIPFVLLPPVFSDDIHRLRWDGRVLASGVDPYRYAPSDPALDGLRDASSMTINHPDIPTVYGPLAQALLALLALSPSGASLTSIKAMAALFDLLAVASLASLARPAAGIRSADRSRESRSDSPGLAAFAYAVHPLAVIETAGEGHLDGAAVALLLAAFALLERGRNQWAALLAAAAGLVKLTPLFAAPALLRKAGPRAAAAAAALFLVAHLPFASSGGPFRGLGTYARSWEGNGAVYPELVALLNAGDVAARAKAAYARVKAALGHPAFLDRGWRFFYDGFLARAILGLCFLGALAAILHRVSDPLEAAGLSLAALLLLSPTLHPWYLLEVLPFALLFRWTSVAWVAGAAPLAHLAALPAGLVRTVELLPAVALYIVFDRRRRAA